MDQDRTESGDRVRRPRTVKVNPRQLMLFAALAILPAMLFTVKAGAYAAQPTISRTVSAYGAVLHVSGATPCVGEPEEEWYWWIVRDYGTGSQYVGTTMAVNSAATSFDYPTMAAHVTEGTHTYRVVCSPNNTLAESATPATQVSTAQQVTITTPALPNAPSVTATAGNTKVTLSWPAQSKASGYSIYDDEDEWVVDVEPEANVGLITHEVTGLTNGVEYGYSVESWNEWTTSPRTPLKYATPTATPPPAPAAGSVFRASALPQFMATTVGVVTDNVFSIVTVLAVFIALFLVFRIFNNAKTGVGNGSGMK